MRYKSIFQGKFIKILQKQTTTKLDYFCFRCVVCETTTRVIALHSQSMSIPECPRNWEEMWTGYSYYMVSKD